MFSKIGNTAMRKQVRNMVKANHERIEVKGGTCRYNFRCSYNAVDDAIKNGDDKIAMIIYLDGDYAIIHFVNYHDGEFIDNTLGEWTTQHDHYFIRWINKEEFWEVNDIFGAYRRELRKSLHWLTKLTSDETC